MKNKFLLLVAALLLSTTATFAANQLISINSETQATAISRDDMMLQVKEYMEDRGVIVVSVAQILGTENYLVKDAYGKSYTVYTSNGVILGHDENDF